MKRILKILIVILFCLSINVHAGTDTYDREELKNYGVNKDWEITESNKSNILKTYAVNAAEKIYDFSDILTDDEEKTLKEQVDYFIKKYKTDVVIFIDDLKYTSDYENENYASDFYDYNDFGMDYNNSGIVLFRNTYSKNPYYNIYMFGDAQLYMSSERVEATLDNIYDYLHSKKYVQGFTKFVNDLSIYYSQGIPKEMQKYEVNENGYLVIKYTIPWFQSVGISLVITFIVMLVMIQKNQMVHSATKANEYLNRQTSNITNRRDVFLSTSTQVYNLNNTSSGQSGSSSGASNTGSSGGGHSSGSGRHG